MPAGQNHSELLFENYLRGLGLEFAYEPDSPGRAKHPDYRVQFSGRSFWFEVKESSHAWVPETDHGQFDPTLPLRKKIDSARDKFKEFKDDCCILVLHSCSNIFIRTDISAVVAAAFGEFLTLEPPKGQTLNDVPFRFRAAGTAMLHSDKNTTISAILILQHFQIEARLVKAWHQIHRRLQRGETVSPFAYAEELQAIGNAASEIAYQDSARCLVLENPHARISFPRDLCHGPLDQRWGLDEASGWYTLISLGKELEHLRNGNEPVPYMLL
jgi:hypothetical protein